MIDTRPAAVIFDLDGTLIDSLPGIEFSVKAAFDACGVHGTTNDLHSMIGPPIRTILEQAGNVTDERELLDLEKAFRKSYDDEGWKMSTCYPEASASSPGNAERRNQTLRRNQQAPTHFDADSRTAGSDPAVRGRDYPRIATTRICRQKRDAGVPHRHLLG